MEVRKIILAVLLALSISAFGQERFSELGISTFRKSFTSVTSFPQNVKVDFVANDRGYLNAFELGETLISQSNVYLEWTNRFKFDKNSIGFTLQAGLNFHLSDFDLYLVDTLSSQGFDGPGSSDSEIWNSTYAAPGESHQFERPTVIPTLRLGVHYYRTIFQYRDLQFDTYAGFSYQHRFGFLSRDLNISLNNNETEEIQIDMDDVIDPKPGQWAYEFGMMTRFNSTNFKLGVGLPFGVTGSRSDISQFKETQLQLGLSKIIDHGVLTKEELLLSLQRDNNASKIRRIRRGDKFSYLAIHPNSIPGTIEESNNLFPDYVEGPSGIVARYTQYYEYKPEMYASLSFNTFITNRILSGIGYDFYSTRYARIGYVQDTVTMMTEEFGVASSNSFDSGGIDEEDPYVDAQRLRYHSLSLMFAFYLNGSQRAIEPFLKARALYNASSENLTGNKNYIDPDHKVSFASFKLGAGVDFRLRVKSSKYVVLTLGGDYVIHPVRNYTQATVAWGYYRKKKLSNQRY